MSPSGNPTGHDPDPAGPRPADEHVRRRLQRQPTRDTAPELALRRLLHARGLRYRVDAPVVPGLRRRADILFTRARLAVFVDGCFWHACPEHGAAPKNNAAWWRDKLAANVRRDRDTDQRLQAAGWRVLRIWEHVDPEEAVGMVWDAFTAGPPPDVPNR